MKIMDRKHLEYTYLFGPIPSRRLGLSLGVDLMPHKTCSLDCIYCECGKTTQLTLQRDEYTPVDKIKKELSHFLSGDPPLDHITFSGSGEPLLHRHIQEIICFIKKKFPQYKLALLTNGTLLNTPEVQEEIIEIDIVKVSVDAVSEDIFVKLNRPHPYLNAAGLIEGLHSFRKIFKNQIWIEFFLVPGVNDGEAEIRSVKEAIKDIQADRIHVNTLDRPGAEGWVQPADRQRLKKAMAIFGDGCLIEQPTMCSANKKDIGSLQQYLLSTIKRRPCTASDLSEILGTHFSETKKHLEMLNKKGKIEKQEMPRGVFYMMKSDL